MINEKTWARNRVQRHAGLHFVYKKSENDKEYTEYKEKIRYILCLKIFVETIYRIIHRVGIILLSRGKPDHPVLGQNNQRNQKEKIILQIRPCKVWIAFHVCEVVVLFYGLFWKKMLTLQRVLFRKKADIMRISGK